MDEPADLLDEEIKFKVKISEVVFDTNNKVCAVHMKRLTFISSHVAFDIRLLMAVLPS